MATLWIIATPIGNLGDLSYRAEQVIKKAALVIAEDTRAAKIILQHINTQAKLEAFHSHSAKNTLAKIFDSLEEGQDIVYLTDAGTPNISDPGRELCAYAFANHYDIKPIPGPSAITAALSVCPFTERGFVFLGFLPRKGTKRQKDLQFIKDSQLLTVVFEAPNRFVETINELVITLEPERQIMVAREMTKLYEQYLVFKLQDWDIIKPQIPELGEFTIIIDHSPHEPEPSITASQLAYAMQKAGITGRSGLNFLKHLPKEILQTIRNQIYNKKNEYDE